MARGTVDRATAYMVPAYLTSKQLVPWISSPALAFTIAAIHAPHLVLATNVAADWAPSQLWGEFVNSLGDLAQPQAAGPRVRDEALAATREAAGNIHAILGAVAQLQSDRSFEHWFMWNVQFEWVEHTIRRGGFFDIEFSAEIALILEMTVNEVHALWRAFQNIAEVEQLVDRFMLDRPTESDSAVANCWLVATILRGYYHAEISRRQRRQLLSHPIRGVCCPSANSADERAFSINSAHVAFGKLLLG